MITQEKVAPNNLGATRQKGRLEGDTDGPLHQARLRAATASRVELAGQASKLRGAGAGDRALVGDEVRVVENVERLKTELHKGPLGEVDVLGHTAIQVKEPGRVERKEVHVPV